MLCPYEVLLAFGSKQVRDAVRRSPALERSKILLTVSTVQCSPRVELAEHRLKDQDPGEGGVAWQPPLKDLA